MNAELMSLSSYSLLSFDPAGHILLCTSTFCSFPDIKSFHHKGVRIVRCQQTTHTPTSRAGIHTIASVVVVVVVIGGVVVVVEYQ